jgi:hypothetical protein
VTVTRDDEVLEDQRRGEAILHRARLHSINAFPGRPLYLSLLLRPHLSTIHKAPSARTPPFPPVASSFRVCVLRVRGTHWQDSIAPAICLSPAIFRGPKRPVVRVPQSIPRILRRERAPWPYRRMAVGRRVAV